MLNFQWRVRFFGRERTISVRSRRQRRRKNMHPRRRSALLAFTTLSALVFASAAHADEPLEHNDIEIGTVDGEHIDDRDADQLTARVVPAEMDELASQIAGTYADHPQYASVEVTMDRTEVVVHWYGKVPLELESDIERAEAEGVRSRVAPTSVDPNAVREYARSLMRNDPSVKSVVVAKDAASITATTEGALRARTAAAQIDPPEGLTVNVQEGDVAELSTRQADITYRLGGARILRFEDPFVRGECTSGFVVRKLNNSSQHGMLTAAHCGANGSNWIVSDGTFAYSWGNVGQRDTTFDGMVVSGTYHNSFIWTSTWNSNVYTPINGVRNPYVGQEICYSGSFSGLVCGNIVDSTTVPYGLGGDLSSLSGFLTINSAGVPAAGNGDSGGPGYTLVNTTEGLKRYAVGLVSAGPTATSSATCQGVPGGTGPFDRKCSPAIIATPVNSLNAALGWYIPTS
ncbi:S1 family peptidase [Cellulosimicrobium cellulans]|uniref:S1 family peptidase n=1 Tax=Cellulosimicrobium cellulans TaxID=1710 RepID=UPI0036EA6CCC